MKLFLASEAKNPVSIKKLEEYVGGFEGKKIAYIPTAANGEGWGNWKEGGTWNLFQTLKADITLVQLEDYFNKDVVTDLENKDIIFFAGGFSGYLMYWIKRTQLDKSLKTLLENGALYVGSSAGSMITGKTLDVSEWFIQAPEYGVAGNSGLGLVDFDFYPHYTDDLYDEIKKKYNGNKLYLLKNGEELIIEDGVVKVIGEERVI
jgi:dipeptidase E